MTFDRSQLHTVVARYYGKKLLDFGPTSRGVDWKDEQSHNLRHRQFLYLLNGDMSGSICDLGCGYGHFLPFLRSNGFIGAYAGYDLAPEMVEEARRLHGQNALEKWKVGGAPSEQYDYVIASGIFNVRQQIEEAEWITYIFDTIDHMAKASRRGFAFNVLSLCSDPEFRRSDLYYADPAELLNYCLKKYGRKIALLQDTPLYEFTLIVRHPTS